MALQATLYTVDGKTKTYPQTKYIPSEAYTKVSCQRIDDSTWEVMHYDKYNVINNSIVLLEPADGTIHKQIQIVVADSQDELSDNPSDVAIVAAIANEVAIVAGIEQEVADVASEPLKSAIIDNHTEPLRQAILDAETHATGTQLNTWNSEAEAMTSASYAKEGINTNVKEYSSNGDGTFTATTTSEYSAKHYASLSSSGFKKIEYPTVVDGQTVIPTIYDANVADVYINGVMLMRNKDYTTTVAEITLASPIETNDGELDEIIVISGTVLPEIEDGTVLHVPTVSDLTSTLAQDITTAIVQEEGRGGTFVYDASQSAVNNGGTIFNGWVRQYDGAVNVKWFGAVGDGVTDDTSALQNALDNSFYLLIPNGVFSTTGLSISSRNNIKIIGSKSSALKLKVPSINSVISIESSSNISIEGILIDGNRAEQTVGTHGIRLGDTTDVVIDDVKIQNCYHYGIGAQVGTIKNTLITNVSIKNTGGDGIDFKNHNSNNFGNLITNTVIENYGLNDAEVTLQTGIDCRGPVNIENVTIKAGISTMPGIVGLRLRESSVTTGAGGDYCNINNVKIEGNSGASSIGLSINAKFSNFNNIQIDNFQFGVEVRDSWNAVSNGKISGCGTSVRLVPLGINGIVDIKGFILSNVSSHNSTYRAIDIRDNTLNSVIKGCTFRNIGTGAGAIRTSGTTNHHVIDGCNFLDDGKYIENGASGKVTAKNNIGYETEANLITSSLAVDSTGSKTFVVPHGLDIIPSLEDISLTLIMETSVTDYKEDFVRVESIDATNITGRMVIGVASGTAGATAKIGIKIQQNG